MDLNLEEINDLIWGMLHKPGSAILICDLQKGSADER
jgi:hypothetical protein